MYEIIARHPEYGREVVDTAADKAEALYLQNEYCKAYGPEWLIIIKKRGIKK